MLRRKKSKTREEKTAGEYFPVHENDLKYAVEKPVKEEIAQEIVEEIKKTRKKKTGGKSIKKPSKSKIKKETKKTKEYKQPEIWLKKDGYELIITEKPQAAMKIASALGKSSKKNIGGVPYYEVDRNGKKIIVACAVGHLFNLKQETNGPIPIFNIKWIPNFISNKKDFTKKYYDALLKLAKGAGSLTVATDYDVEGEVIGLNVVRFIANQKDAARMKFSTLTPDELNKAYETKAQSLNWGHAIAGETRHYLDWFYGINLSRALMNAIKSTGKFRIMSIGRVQGPTLNLIVKKEKEIQAFKPTPYWQVFITVKNAHTVELKYIKDITKKADLKKFENLKGKTAIAETKKTEQTLLPPEPFNLTTLQTEAYKFFGITPSKALQIAQSLYLAGLISYPRTSSQKLPESINYTEILKKLARQYNVEKLITKTKPIEGKKSDPAHPSIYPTGQSGIMSAEERKIYELIVKRFLALFCDSAVIDNKTIRATVENLIFSAKGSEIRKKAWLEIYPARINEKHLPDLDGEVKITKVRTEEKETQPPKRYSPASIISELEKRNLGTKSTRAAILETLYDRNYIRERAVQATPLGISLISSLEKHSPIIIDEQLTRHFEKEMDSIQETKKNPEEKEKKIIDEAKTAIIEIIKQFEKNENKIGEELTKANQEIIQKQREENTLTPCPVCKVGNLRILYNRGSKRYFAACSAYPNCKTTYTLPHGLIKNANKACPHCSFPMLIRIQKAKRPWEFCFNPNCPNRKQEKKEE